MNQNADLPSSGLFQPICVDDRLRNAGAPAPAHSSWAAGKEVAGTWADI